MFACLRQGLLLVLPFGVLTSGRSSAMTPRMQEGEAASALSRSFQCPESYSSDEKKNAALREFMQAYTAAFPNNNVRDLMLFRYRLLVAHTCTQTLKSMLASVSPVSEMLSIQGSNYGPRTEEFNPKTRVWTVRFRADGEPLATTEKELIFNFYGWGSGPTAKAIAEAFVSRRDNVHVLGNFEAPDDITKAPAYFIVSETLYPGESDGYVNISKVSSVGDGAYTVTFSKKISGTNVEQSGRAWFLGEEGQGISRAISHVGVDPGWQQYLTHK